MIRTLYLFYTLIVITLLSCPLSAEPLVVVSNTNFPLQTLTPQQVKQIFLKRTRYIKDIEIFPINIYARGRYRKAFEKNIMKMNTFALKRHWTRAHYHGIRPPKVLSSIQSTIAFIRNVDGAIAYIPLSNLPSDLHVILKVIP